MWVYACQIKTLIVGQVFLHAGARMSDTLRSETNRVSGWGDVQRNTKALTHWCMDVLTKKHMKKCMHMGEKRYIIVITKHWICCWSWYWGSLVCYCKVFVRVKYLTVALFSCSVVHWCGITGVRITTVRLVWWPHKVRLSCDDDCQPDWVYGIKKKKTHLRERERKQSSTQTSPSHLVWVDNRAHYL